MTTPGEGGLRESLHDLADQVTSADMYERAVHRSRRIARREAAIGTVAALAVLVLLASGLWRLPDRDTGHTPMALISASAPAPEPMPSPIPSAIHHPETPEHHASTRTTSPRRKNQPRAATPTATPKSRALADLPGHVFYQQTGNQPDVVRLSPTDGDTTTVLSGAPSAVGISPDGNRIAYAVGGVLLVGETGSAQSQPVATGITTTAQAPAWSPDGARLLVVTSRPAILQVDSGTLTPLPGRLAAGQHFRWSGDGNTLVYATTYCSLKVSSGESNAVVPMFGDRQPVDNPDGLAACKPTSVDVTGQHVTVPLQSTGDIGTASTDPADVVVDTITGDLEPLPVAGSVVGAVFGPDGNLLVRARTDESTTLSVFSPAGKLLVQAVEPAAVHDLNLLAYTR
ncbi:TolB protein [Actinoplanes tereljensis]|uniref:TolB protein n=1 Tax=Paractinoplanes tereljensis TaxID=571912 RepID=A0A919NKH8_9ACTN|nr:PD40 domain-containing protein [Actinoplanes tereljensis]GIF19694.1 hypothetical protein Ate02nite_24240 [Actinoplanes tereljensis]